MKPLLTALWPQFSQDKEFLQEFSDAIVERVEANRTKKTITVVLSGAKPITAHMRARLCASLEPIFTGFAVKAQSLFSYANITNEAVVELCEELKENGVPINGFLIDAAVFINGTDISINVNNGITLLNQIEFTKLLEDMLFERTNQKVNITLTCGEAINKEEVEQKMLKKMPTKKF
ncbi:MAG: PolC-type DNA polymerase III, partial [Oscillospiraceae bacterium]